MEPIFQVKYTITQEIINEYHKKVAPVWVSIVFHPVIILVTGFIAYLAYKNLQILVFTVVLSIVIICIGCEQAKNTYRNYFESHRLNKLENMERIICFDDQINAYNTGTGSRSVYEYSQIGEIIETRNLYILLLPYRMGIFLEKGKFTIGSEAEFKTFIKSKCLHLKK